MDLATCGWGKKFKLHKLGFHYRWSKTEFTYFRKVDKSLDLQKKQKTRLRYHTARDNSARNNAQSRHENIVTEIPVGSPSTIQYL